MTRNDLKWATSSFNFGWTLIRWLKRWNPLGTWCKGSRSWPKTFDISTKESSKFLCIVMHSGCSSGRWGFCSKTLEASYRCNLMYSSFAILFYFYWNVHIFKYQSISIMYELKYILVVPLYTYTLNVFVWLIHSIFKYNVYVHLHITP